MTSGAADIQPDLDQARWHLMAVDPKAETFVFQTFDDSGKKDPALAHVVRGSLEQCAPFLSDMNRRGAGIFVTVNRSSNGGRKKTDITGCRAIWREADAPDLAPLPIKPHLKIETSPGKYHEYLLTESADLETADAIMRTMVDVHGSDPNAKDRSRVLRVAGFIHRKKTPHMVRIIEQNDMPRYPLEQIAQSIPPAPKPTGNLKQYQTGTVKTEKYAASALSRELTDLACAPEHTRNDQLNRAAYSLGQLIAGGELDRGHVETALTAAAIGVGLVPGEVGATIRSGIDAGMAKPRTAPERPENAPQGAIFTKREDKLPNDFTLDVFAMNGLAEQMEAQMLEDKYVAGRLAIYGQSTAWYAGPNLGKTLLATWLLIEKIKSGEINGADVFYINADDNHKGLVYKLKLSGKVWL